MPKDLFNRYVWIVDTIRRYGAITRDDLSRKWLQSSVSDGRPLTRRTFYNYRNAIEELFQISIVCNPATFEYSIESAGDNDESITNWLLNSAAVTGVLSDSRQISDRIFVEEVPSARVHLATVIDAVKGQQRLRMSYHPFTRSTPTPGIILEPYFLKIFRQRWYVTGRNVADDRLKTYALDRIVDLTILPDTFELPPLFDARDYQSNAFGIVFDMGEPKQVQIKVDARQAKYFRALPLHHSQQESIHDAFSIFSYKLKLTPDFLQELLSYGPRVTVLAPPELKAMMIASLKESLGHYL